MASWKKCACTNCKRWLTSLELAEIHYTGRCPACKELLDLDAKRALSHAQSTKILAIILTALFVCADGALLRFAGMSDSTFNGWSPSYRLMLAFAVVMTGTTAIVLIQFSIKHLLLKITFRKLKKAGKI